MVLFPSVSPGGAHQGSDFWAQPRAGARTPSRFARTRAAGWP